jgi:hypothetical protein
MKNERKRLVSRCLCGFYASPNDNHGIGNGAFQHSFSRHRQRINDPAGFPAGSVDSPFRGRTEFQEKIMRTNLLALTLLAAIAAPAAAQDSTVTLASIPASSDDTQYVTVTQLAEETGLTPQRVRMVVGARSGYGEYRITFDRAQKQFRNALGEQRYNDLMAGRRIELYNQRAANVASIR